VNECLDPAVCSEQSPGCEDVIATFFCLPALINTTVAPLDILDDTWITIVVGFELDTVLVTSGDIVLVDEIYYLHPEYLQPNASDDRFDIHNVTLTILTESNELLIHASVAPG